MVFSTATALVLAVASITTFPFEYVYLGGFSEPIATLL
jgi:hypothetical protein